VDAQGRAALYDSVLASAVAAHEHARRQNPAALFAAADAIVSSVRAGGKVLVFGNGGSAADAQHFSAELVGRLQRERRAIPAVALSTDTSVLTAVANDYAFDRVFARQIEALGRAGDVAIGISTSGASSNVVAGLEIASRAGLTTVAVTGGDGGALGEMAAIHINVPVADTARAQEVHRTLLHVLCELVERELDQ
jgi:phosphoheptose isomerase